MKIVDRIRKEISKFLKAIRKRESSEKLISSQSLIPSGISSTSPKISNLDYQQFY